MFACCNNNNVGTTAWGNVNETCIEITSHLLQNSMHDNQNNRKGPGKKKSGTGYQEVPRTKATIRRVTFITQWSGKQA